MIIDKSPADSTKSTISKAKIQSLLDASHTTLGEARIVLSCARVIAERSNFSVDSQILDASYSCFGYKYHIS